MKKIYFVLTHTGTILSRIIKNYTKDEFSHVSIALDEQLEQMYSFGRVNPYNPIWGGFVHENIHKGTYKRFFKTKTKIISMEIEEEKYINLKNIIMHMESKKYIYRFNIIGLFAAGFQKKIGKENSFYCAEFVKYVLEKANINLNLPEVVKPEHFKTLPQTEEVYSGLLRKYIPKKIIIHRNVKKQAFS